MEEIRSRREAERDFMMLCAGTVAAAVYNAAPFRKRGATVVKATDFVPGRGNEDGASDLSPKEIYEHMSAWARSHNSRTADA